MHNSPNKPDQKGDEINIKIKNENTGNQLIEDRLTEEKIKDTKDKIDKSNKVENNTNFKNNGNQVNNNNLIQEEEVKDIQAKLDEFIKVKGINNMNLENRSKNVCKTFCLAICLILCVIILLLIELAFHFSISFIFIYYNNKYKKCKAELYKKNDTIINIYIALLILILILIFFSIILNFIKEKYFGLSAILGIIIILLSISIIALQLTNLIIVQKNFNKSESWENCGNFENWAIFWLVINYISFTLTFLKDCLSVRNRQN